MNRFEHHFVKVPAQSGAEDQVLETTRAREAQGWEVVSIVPFVPGVWLVIYKRDHGFERMVVLLGFGLVVLFGLIVSFTLFVLGMGGLS